MFDTGTTAFMLISTSLVMLMTPGLALFYGGLTNKKNILGIMIQSFASLGITTVLWYIVGYSLTFSGKGLFIGNLDKMFLAGVSITTPFAGNRAIPEILFFAYQMMFAIITPSIITGAFANRVSFKAYVIFLVAWQIFVYYPLAHMLWGGGILEQWGVLEFAGGIIVHAASGFAALASVIYIGARSKEKHAKPNNIPLVALGTALLYFGWYGFNAGSELAVNQITVQAFINTDIAASFAAVAWLMIEWKHKRKPKFIGLLTGILAGLVVITPAAGYVPLWAAALMGILGSLICYFAIEFKNKKHWDDALDVWGIHGIGGVLGAILTGVFASLAINNSGANGLIYGNGLLVIKQIIAVLCAITYSFIFTYIMLAVINKITKVRVSESEEEMGLDIALHDERAYSE